MEIKSAMQCANNVHNIRTPTTGAVVGGLGGPKSYCNCNPHFEGSANKLGVLVIFDPDIQIRLRQTKKKATYTQTFTLLILGICNLEFRGEILCLKVSLGKMLEFRILTAFCNVYVHGSTKDEQGR